MAIVAFHLRPFLAGFLGQIVGMGHVAVPFFFMLSGFILGLVYLSHGRPVRARRFWATRFARLYPLYLVSLAIDLPHYIHTRAMGLQSTSHSTFAVLASCLLLVQSWTGNPPGLNDPAWSLSVEVFFYLLFPLLGAALWRIKRAWLLPVACLVFLAGLSTLLRADGASAVGYDPLRHLPTFMLGILLSRFALHGVTNEAAQRSVARWSVLAMVLGAAAIIAASSLWRYPGLLQHGLLVPAFAAILLACTAQSGWVPRVLAHPWLVRLGHASYALFLLHFPVKTMCRPFLEAYPRIAVPLYLAGIVCLSVLSFKYFEMPARSLLLRWAGLPVGRGGSSQAPPSPPAAPGISGSAFPAA